ncbi:MAG TPA: hypothetical protein VMU33_00690 [Burkholderiaceae bacterium]|nr:hypothetical protein [Burkholderiaceae bacterium]
MMFLVSLPIVAILLLLATAVGRGLLRLLPGVLRRNSGLYLAPALGLAVWVLVATVHGWLFAFNPITSAPLALALLVAGIAADPRRRELIRDWTRLCAFGLLAALPILAPALRFDAFNPFNDTFTYLVHSQWLQVHAYSEPARASGFYPTETQVLVYQIHGYRMGGSFFLAFVQSLFALDWSYDAYLPTLGFVFAVGCLGVGAVVRQILPLRPLVCLATCLLPAYTLNGYAFGAEYGFLPQTFGLTFLGAIVAMVPGLCADALRAPALMRVRIARAFPAAVVLAAFLVCYNDMLPVVVAIVGLFVVVTCVTQAQRRLAMLGTLIILAVEVAAIVNVESVRILRSVVGTAFSASSGDLRFGWPVRWTPIQFLAHSFGMKSAFDGGLAADDLLSRWVFAVVLLVIIGVVAILLRRRRCRLQVIFLLCADAVFAAAFLKFRYFTAGHDGEVGYTFLQFKIAKWATLFNLSLLAACLGWLIMRRRWVGGAAALALVAAIAAGAVAYVGVIPELYTKQFQDEAMRAWSPFSEMLELRSRLDAIPKNKTVYLAIGGEHHKLRQMVAYVLWDRKVASSYDDDGYIAGTLPPNERRVPIGVADWLVELKRARDGTENPLARVGPFYIRAAPFASLVLDRIDGAYEAESDGTKTWNWVRDAVEYRFHVVGSVASAALGFDYLAAVSDTRHLRVAISRIADGKTETIAEYDRAVPGGWGHFADPRVRLAGGNATYVVRIAVDGEAHRLSGTDPREAKFMVQDLKFEGSD